jgi:hypothetical protein
MTNPSRLGLSAISLQEALRTKSVLQEFPRFNMNNATSTVLILAIPLALITVVQFGRLRSTGFFLAVGMLLSLAIAILLIAGMGASAIAAGHGGGDSGGWEGSSPLILHGIVSAVLLILGAIARPESRRPTKDPGITPTLKTLRECEEQLKKEAEQAGTGQPATRSVLDFQGGDKPQPESEGGSR